MKNDEWGIVELGSRSIESLANERRGTAHTSRLVAASLALGCALMLAPGNARSGCGCDHPPPDWAPVMPVFAASGTSIRIWADGDPYEVGTAYEVEVDGVAVPGGGVVAKSANHLEVTVPSGVEIGPASIRVFREVRSWWRSSTQDVHVDYDGSYFTVLPAFVDVPPVDGVYESRPFEVAIDSEGTVLLPLNLSEIRDATQFAFQFKDLPLAFGPRDVVFYSRDGVDLTLFSLAVDDSARRQWGSYQGWEVDEDGSLSGYRFENKRTRARDLMTSSDVLTYWRHEFHTYAEAHEPGGEYEVNDNGFHPDGTLHIEHGYIVLAIKGRQRHWMFPDNPHFERDLAPGGATVGLNAVVQGAEQPIEPAIMVPIIEETAPESLEDAAEAFFETAGKAAESVAPVAVGRRKIHSSRSWSRWR
jgi:hypothetical protein